MWSGAASEEYAMSDEPITDEVIERFLVGKHWWLTQPHTRLAYRIIRWQDKRINKLESEIAELRRRLGIEQTKHVDKVMKERR